MTDQAKRRAIECGQACITCGADRPRHEPTLPDGTLWACSWRCAVNFNGQHGIVPALQKVAIGLGCSCG